MEPCSNGAHHFLLESPSKGHKTLLGQCKYCDATTEGLAYFDVFELVEQRRMRRFNYGTLENLRHYEKLNVD
jgi:hypothetical protein